MNECYSSTEMYQEGNVLKIPLFWDAKKNWLRVNSKVFSTLRFYIVYAH